MCSTTFINTTKAAVEANLNSAEAGLDLLEACKTSGCAGNMGDPGVQETLEACLVVAQGVVATLSTMVDSGSVGE